MRQRETAREAAGQTAGETAASLGLFPTVAALRVVAQAALVRDRALDGGERVVEHRAERRDKVVESGRVPEPNATGVPSL